MRPLRGDVSDRCSDRPPPGQRPNDRDDPPERVELPIVLAPARLLLSTSGTVTRAEYLEEFG